MIFHQCNCHYVPNNLLAKVARGHQSAGETARLSLLQTRESSRKRQNKPMSMSLLRGIGETASRDRVVYDCENGTQQRLNQVRTGTEGPTADDTVNTVFEHAGTVLTYLTEYLERDSIDGLGMDLILNVHFGTDYMNAYWDGDEMTFGDGDGDIFTSFTKSLDVVAHELSHGITQHTANLDYFSQSGALNEHFADVFGSAVQQFKNGESAGDADWLVGDEIMGPTLFGEALRSMKAPGSAFDNNLLGRDSQPAHMRDYYSGSEDNQGVHINSGIPNRAFYLAAMDMGTHKAMKIWFHALQRLWPTANFEDAVQVIVNSAKIITKEDPGFKGATQTIRLAFHDVGL